jgi:glycosyltransferase involved in cell wall biosynthesis
MNFVENSSQHGDYWLTIGIPTWNRAQYLKDNIQQILQEMEKYPQLSIEILVSDNASADETQTYCKALSEKYSFFSYWRNATNIGANANFQQVLEYAQGTYVWLLGDDDKIVEDCLQKISASIIAFNQPEIIIGGCVNDQTGVRLYPPFIDEPLLANYSIIKQYDAIRLAGKISTLIFHKATIMPILKLAQPVIQQLKTPWPHLIWFILLLNQQAHVLFLAYNTNYSLEENRYNMIQDGISRTNIMVREYAALIYYLNELCLLNADFYRLLIKSITHSRQGEMLKIVGYSTYFNKYFASLLNAVSNFIYLPNCYNRCNFLFYALPLILPIVVRKTLLNMVAFLFPGWLEYKRYLSYLKTTKQLFIENNKRNIFDKEGL